MNNECQLKGRRVMAYDVLVQKRHELSDARHENYLQRAKEDYLNNPVPTTSWWKRWSAWLMAPLVVFFILPWALLSTYKSLKDLEDGFETHVCGEGRCMTDIECSDF